MIQETAAADAATQRNLEPVAVVRPLDEPTGSCEEFVADGPEDASRCDAPTVPSTPHCLWHLEPGEAVEVGVEDAPLPDAPPFYPLPRDDFELSPPVDNPFRVLVLDAVAVRDGHRWMVDVLGDLIGGTKWTKHPARRLLDELVACLEEKP